MSGAAAFDPGAWRRGFVPRPVSTAPEIVFLTPLMSRAYADDWTALGRAFARTVASLRAQSDPNWRLLVCSQDRPGGIAFDDRVRFVAFDEVVEGFDKKHKNRTLCAALPRNVCGDGYAFALDGDDVLHPDLVGWMRRDHNGRGYWLSDGYLVDAATGAVGRLAPRRPWAPLRRPFVAQCGSSGALYVDFRADRGFVGAAAHFLERTHRNFRAAGRELGLPLDRVPFPAALYVMNTGANMRAKRGKLDRKLVQLGRSRLRPHAAAAVLRSFGWSDG